MLARSVDEAENEGAPRSPGLGQAVASSYGTHVKAEPDQAVALQMAVTPACAANVQLPPPAGPPVVRFSSQAFSHWIWVGPARQNGLAPPRLAQQVASTHLQVHVSALKTLPLAQAGRHAPVLGHRFMLLGQSGPAQPTPLRLQGSPGATADFGRPAHRHGAAGRAVRAAAGAAAVRAELTTVLRAGGRGRRWRWWWRLGRRCHLPTGPFALRRRQAPAVAVAEDAAHAARGAAAHPWVGRAEHVRAGGLHRAAANPERRNQSPDEVAGEALDDPAAGGGRRQHLAISSNR